MGSIAVTVATAASGGDIPITDATVTWTDAAGTHHVSAGLNGSATVELTGLNSTLITASAPGFDVVGATGTAGQPLLIQLPLAGGGGTPPPPSLSPPSPVTNLKAVWNAPTYTELSVSCDIPGNNGPPPNYGQYTAYIFTASGTGGTTGTLQAIKTGPPITGLYLTVEWYYVPIGSYEITATAQDTGGTSAAAHCTVPGPPPGAISNFAASWNAGFTAVNLSWSQAAGSPPSVFQVQRFAGSYSPSSSAQAVFNVNPGTSYTDTSIHGSSTTPIYQYLLLAQNSFGKTQAVSNPVFPPQHPAITGLQPVGGVTAGGDTVIINGSGLATASAVHFGNTAAASPIKIVSDSEIQVVSPPHAAGLVNVTVTAVGGTSTATSVTQQFRYATFPAISGVSPNKGLISGGTSVTISGTGFSGIGIIAVDFGAAYTNTFKVVSDSEITVAAPPAKLPGPVDVTLYTDVGTSAKSAADIYTYVEFDQPIQGPGIGGPIKGVK